MLEQVALNQERFRAPGLRTDSRGIAIGERGLLRFGTLSQVVGFFRAFTEEQSLDYLLPTLKITKARSRIQGLEILVELPSQGSHMLDRAAAITRLLRGEVFTGRSPHFVRYRDAQAPFGYDIQRLVATSDGMVLYTRTGPLQFKEEGTIAFRGLLMSLSRMRRRHEVSQGSLYIRVPPGLRTAVQRFLWQRDISAGVTELHRRASGRFDEGESFYLFRIETFPPRLLPLFDGLPGVELYHTRRSNIFVQRNYDHPFALESCRKAMDDGDMYFFSGARDTVDQVEGEPQFVDINHLKGLELQDPTLTPRREAQLMSQGAPPPPGWTAQQVREALHYPVHLIHRPDLRNSVSALFISTPQEMLWLKRLIYMMPQTALEAYQMAVTDQGCLVLNRKGVELLPIGMQLREVFNNVFIPADTLFSPPIGVDQLQRHLGLQAGKVYFMPRGLQQAFFVDEAGFKPMARYLLADVALREVADKAPEPMSMKEGVEMVNRDVGYFALWGHNLRRVNMHDEVGPTQPMRALPPAGPKS